MTQEQFEREVRFRYAMFLIDALKAHGLIKESEHHDAKKRIARKYRSPFSRLW